MAGFRNQLFFEKLPAERPINMKLPEFASLLGLGLLVFILMNVGLRGYLEANTPNFGSWLVVSKWKLLLGLEEPKDFVFLGDSAANQAVIPEVIVEQTGYSAVNFATLANLTVLNDVWMLRYYVSKYGPPRAAFVVHSYMVWGRDLKMSLVSHLPILQIPNAQNVLQPSPMAFPGYFRERILSYLPVYSQNSSIRELLRLSSEFRVAPVKEYTLTPLGHYSLAEQMPTELERNISSHLASIAQDQGGISRENVLGLAALAELAEMYDFPVYLINAPLVDEIVSFPEFDRYFSPIDRYLKHFADENPYVQYIPEFHGYPRALMEISDHLLESGAEQYTREVIVPLVEVVQE